MYKTRDVCLFLHRYTFRANYENKSVHVVAEVVGVYCEGPMECFLQNVHFRTVQHVVPALAGGFTF
jgi:hypothetical protein